MEHALRSQWFRIPGPTAEALGIAGKADQLDHGDRPVASLGGIRRDPLVKWEAE